jgi:hypothetical protein
MNMKLKKLTILTLGSLAAFGAQAELVDRRSKPEAKPSTVVEGTRMVQPVILEQTVAKGTEYLDVFIREDVDMLAEPITGFGQDIPLSFALSQILPDYKIENQIGKDIPVTWKAGLSRRDTLSQIKAGDKSIAVVVQSLDKRVVIADKMQVQALMDRKVIDEWAVRVSDARLDRALTRWAKKAGYNFKWDAEKHYLVSASSSFYGSFEEALNQVLSTPGIAKSDFPLESCIYGNSPPLVRITRLGDQTNQCK